MSDFISAQQDALDRMKRANARGTGCHLTADMIHALSVSIIGQMWEEDRPDAATRRTEPGTRGGGE